MHIQVLTLCRDLNGTTHQALLLTRALRCLSLDVRLVSLTSRVHPFVSQTLAGAGIELIEPSSERVPEAELSIVVGLWDETSVEAAARLARGKGRLTLSPTTYQHENLLSHFKGRANSLWFVSWDQAVHARNCWYLADQVEVVRCAVDLERFCPADRAPAGRTRILCRHSWDHPAKFALDVTAVLERLGDEQDLVFHMLGAAKSLRPADDNRILTLPQDDVDPVAFLQRGDIWVYAHANYWRETACIAMLEAMACGLPAVVTNAGGMREYMIHGRTGFACNDTNEFVRFTRLLLEQPTLHRLMGVAARQYVHQYHSIESLSHRLRGLLEPKERLTASV